LVKDNPYLAPFIFAAVVTVPVYIIIVSVRGILRLLQAFASYLCPPVAGARASRKSEPPAH
jgi:hypothetical protein